MITIATRFRPFSHSSPTVALLPGSYLAAEICPAWVRVFDPVNDKTVAEQDFLSFCPLTQFTVTLDLEKNRIQVTGFTEEKKYLRYYVSPGSIELVTASESKIYHFQTDALFDIQERERLSLGCTKAQDVALIWRRGELCEIIPFLYYLAQTVPKIDVSESQESSLITELRDAIFECDREAMYKRLLQVVQAGFTALFFPRLFDDSFLGFSLPVLSVDKVVSPLCLLNVLYPLIRSLFFQENGQLWHFLPLVPKQFHAGRLVSLITKMGHKLSIEWTKKSIRRIEVYAAIDDLYSFTLTSDIKRFRLSTKTVVLGWFTNGQEIALVKNQEYFLDRFER